MATPKRGTDGRFLNAEETGEHAAGEHQQDKDQQHQQQQPDPKDQQQQAGDDPKNKDAKDKADNLAGARAFTARYLGIEEKELEGDPAETAEDKKKREDKEKVDAHKKTDKEKREAADKKSREEIENRAAERRRGKPAQQPSQQASAKEIATEVGKEVAKALRTETGKKGETTEKQEPQLSPKEKRRVDTLKEMETLFPEQYKGLSQKYISANEKLADYKKKWEKENPGQEFKQEDPEHNEFFEKNDVGWDDDDYQEAREAIVRKKAREEATQEVRKTLDPEISELKTKERIRESEPIIAREQTSAARVFWKNLGDDLKDIVSENGAVNADQLKKLQEADPEIQGLRIRFAEQLDNEVAMTYRLMHQLVKYDDKNPLHKALSDFAGDMENSLMKKPEKERLDNDGRDFLPMGEYAKLTPAQRTDFWTFSAKDLAVLRANRLAKTAKTAIETEEKRFEERAKRRGLIKKGQDESRETTTNTPENDETETPQEIDGKPVSPTSTTQTKMAAARDQRTQPPKTAVDSFMDRQLQ